MNENENNYLSLKTAAGLYGYTRDHLGLMIRQGKLKGIKLGSYYVTTNEWISDYLKKYADPGHPAVKGKFSNKFLTQAFAAKDPAVAGHGGAKKAKEETKNEQSQSNVQNKFSNDFFSEIQKELLPSLREFSSVQGKNSVSSISSVVSYVNSGNPYVILPIRKMEESERESILNKISGCDSSKNKPEAA
ncbi:MAG: hypothetical protein Q7R61_01720 [bacterium]|nr:hypothetical protein [bacterium]